MWPLAPPFLHRQSLRSLLEASQTESNLPDAPAPAAIFAPVGKPVDYTPRGESTELHNYLYEGFGPYPLIMSAVVAGYHQARHNPPDWREGWVGFSERYASDFGTSAINVSARYALAEAMDEDVYYYRCACTGVWPRLRHAMASVVVARNRITGRPAFALPGVVAPYAGPLVVVRTWYTGPLRIERRIPHGELRLARLHDRQHWPRVSAQLSAHQGKVVCQAISSRKSPRGREHKRSLRKLARHARNSG